MQDLRLGKAYLLGIGRKQNFREGLKLLEPYVKSKDINDIEDIEQLYSKIGQLLFKKCKDDQFSSEFLQTSKDFNLMITLITNAEDFAQNAYFNLAIMEEYGNNTEAAKYYYGEVIACHDKLVKSCSNWEEGIRISQKYARKSYVRLADIAENQKDSAQQKIYLYKLIVDFVINDKIRTSALVDLGFLVKDEFPQKAVICWKLALHVITKLGDSAQIQFLMYNIGVQLLKRESKCSQWFFKNAAKLQSCIELQVYSYLHLAYFRDEHMIDYLEKALALSDGNSRTEILWELFCHDVRGEDLRYRPYLDECAYYGYEPAIKLLESLKYFNEEVNDQEEIQEIFNYEDVYFPSKLDKKIKIDKLNEMQELTRPIRVALENQTQTLLRNKPTFPADHLNFLEYLQKHRHNIAERKALNILRSMPEVKVESSGKKYTVSINNQNIIIGSHYFHSKLKLRNKKCLDPQFAKNLLELLSLVYYIPN